MCNQSLFKYRGPKSVRNITGVDCKALYIIVSMEENRCFTLVKQKIGFNFLFDHQQFILFHILL